ncbi:MAG: hypothetical protein ACUVTF_09900 [bacterium]
MVGNDTVAFVYNLNQASKDGYLYLVFVYDSIKTEFAYTPSNFPLPVTVDFTANFYYRGSYNAPASYHPYYWVFGDGDTLYNQNPTHIYHL